MVFSAAPRTIVRLWLVALSFGWATLARAADLDTAEDLFRTGRYDECAKLAAGEIKTGFWDQRWAELKAGSELARGKDADALTTALAALRRFPANVPLHLIARDAFLFNGRNEDAAAMLDHIETMALAQPRFFSDPEDRVNLGRLFLLKGADAKKVLSQFYDPALKKQPDLVAAYLATAELALGKQDAALAAETLAKAPKDAAIDPRFQLLLARAFTDSDRARSDKALNEAIKINPSHVDSLLLQADHLIDDEKYADAEALLKDALEVNPKEPRAWAYRAVLAHLRNDPAGEAKARDLALERWATDPSVDHLIGRKLSQKYRFAEGSAYQKTSLGVDPSYLPAKLQLCQDWLRLGDETEGWKLADDVFADDGYNVVAYNLITLRDRLNGFRTLEGDGFVVRMDPREADLYGPRVLALLKQAKATLCATYGVTIDEPVVVEIFPQKKEFAVRTFGLPGADGLLGVCFGRVITANSPASQGESPSNWESVLWHEFCHVVTLSKTRNKMPRWLSEGISVYEEGKKDPAWASAMNPKYREMILDEDQFTPLSQLSSAFLGAKTPLHLQFAYFESALAVEFFVGKFGLTTLKDVLNDLGAGISINEALPARTKTTLEQLDHDFAAFARDRAEHLAAPGATWDEPDLPPRADSQVLSDWLKTHEKSIPGWQRLAAVLIEEKKWEKARDALLTLKTLFPNDQGAGNADVLLANVYRRLSDPKAEHAALDALTARDGNAGPAYLRLIELDEAAGDWKGVARNARRLLAVNPLIPAPHRKLATASEHLGDRDQAIAAYRALALLDETDPAGIHYHLATLLRDEGKTDDARREVLKSLEDAPRFLDAHRLLLELAEPKAKVKTP